MGIRTGPEPERMRCEWETERERGRKTMKRKRMCCRNWDGNGSGEGASGRGAISIFAWIVFHSFITFIQHFMKEEKQKNRSLSFSLLPSHSVLQCFLFIRGPSIFYYALWTVGCARWQRICRYVEKLANKTMLNSEVYWERTKHHFYQYHNLAPAFWCDTTYSRPQSRSERVYITHSKCSI